MAELRASWGIANGRTAPQNVQGVVTDFGKTVSPVQSPLQDEKGADIGHTVYDKQTSVNMSVTCKSGTPLPDVGVVLQVGDVTGYVQNASLTENNQSYMKFNVTVDKFSKPAVINDVSSAN